MQHLQKCCTCVRDTLPGEILQFPPKSPSKLRSSLILFEVTGDSSYSAHELESRQIRYSFVQIFAPFSRSYITLLIFYYRLSTGVFDQIAAVLQFTAIWLHWGGDSGKLRSCVMGVRFTAGSSCTCDCSRGRKKREGG